MRVAFTIAIPYNGAHPGCYDATDRVFRAMSTVSKGILPQGSHFHGPIVTSVRSAKQVAQDARRAAKRLAAKGC